jgi:hypothetical protein
MNTFFTSKYSRRNPYFEALLKEGTNTSPIGAHSQGMSRLAFALLAGLERNEMNRHEREEADGLMEEMPKGAPTQQGVRPPSRSPAPANTTADVNPAYPPFRDLPQSPDTGPYQPAASVSVPPYAPRGQARFTAPSAARGTLPLGRMRPVRR